MAVAPPSPPYDGPAPHQGGATNRPIIQIVVHGTAGSEPGVKGAARSTVNWTKTSGVMSSYHYCRDSEEARQLVYDGEVAFHCGANSHRIGYELCCSLANEGGILVKATTGAKALTHWQTPSHRKMLRAAAEDIARLCINEGIPIRKLTVAQIRADEKGLCGHVDIRDAFPGVTVHWDPGPFFPWRRFIRMTRRAARRLTAPPKPAPKPKPEPKPEPEPPKPVVTEHPFTVALLPGRFDAPIDAWLARRDEAIAEGADVVVFTEAHKDKIAKALEPEGYDSARIAQEGPSNVMAVWDSERFELASEPYSVQLDTQQVWTKKGRLRPQTFAVVYPLRDILADKILLLCAAHLPLENTTRRRVAKEQALQSLRDEAFVEGVLRHPTGSTRMLACDWNRNSRSDKVRDWFAEAWPGVTPAWVEGPKSVIDWVAGGKRLELLRRWLVKRQKNDPLDHRTTLSTWGWKKEKA